MTVTTDKGDINEMVFGMTVAIFKDYCANAHWRRCEQRAIECRVEAVRTRDK